MSLSDERSKYDHQGYNSWERREASKALDELETALAAFREAARKVARVANQAGVLEVYDHRAPNLSTEEQIERAAEIADETAGEWLDRALLRDLREMAGE